MLKRLDLLTDRERDVLKQLLKGGTEKEIAKTLGVERWTLHHDVISIYRRWGVTSRSELMADILKVALIAPADDGTSWLRLQLLGSDAAESKSMPATADV